MITLYVVLTVLVLASGLFVPNVFSFANGIDQVNKPTNTLKVAFASWNLAESTPYISDCNFIKDFRDDDLVVLGVQECEDLRPRSGEGSRSLAWNILQKHTLGPAFVRLKKLRMGGIQMSVFAKKSIAKEIQGVKSVCVPCGFGNVMVNKGAVCAVIKIRNSTIAMVNAHLAAHEGALERRNMDYTRIKDTILNKLSADFGVNKNRFNGNNLQSSQTHLRLKKREKIKPISSPKNNLFKSDVKRKRRLVTPVRYGERSRLMKLRLPSAEWPSAIAQNILNMDKSTLDLTIEDAWVGSKSTNSDISMHGRSRHRPRLEKGKWGKWPFDATFFMGDLNYRVEYPKGQQTVRLRKDMNKLARQQTAPTADIVSCSNSSDNNRSYSGNGFNSGNSETLIKRRVVEELLKYDQLGREMMRKNGNIFSHFKEMPISFLPTYKYDHRSHRFDSSTKRRKPSYTDRILFSGNIVNGIGSKEMFSGDISSGDTANGHSNNNRNKLYVQPVKYYSVVDCMHGDHRPVCAKFNVTNVDK